MLLNCGLCYTGMSSEARSCFHVLSILVAIDQGWEPAARVNV